MYEKDLKRSVSSLINHITKSNITIDTVYRIGTFKSGSDRTIRIRFLSHSDRTTAFECRTNLPKNQYLNEDLPFRVRLDLGALRSKRNELFDNKINHSIDWKRKTILCVNGDTFTVKDGVILLQPRIKPPFNPIHEADEQFESSSDDATDGPPPPKKGRLTKSVANAAFLGNRDLARSPPMKTQVPSTSTGNPQPGREASSRPPPRRSTRNQH